jgi:hypothetical protein
MENANCNLIDVICGFCTLLNNTQLEKCPASNLAYTQLLLKIVASCAENKYIFI